MINICVVGPSATGKSTLLRYFARLFGEPSQTLEIAGLQDFRQCHFANQFNVINTPGLETWTYKPKSKLPEIHLFVYCARADTSYSRIDAECFDQFIDCFGPEAWRKTIVLLTFAENVRPLDISSLKALAMRTDYYQKVTSIGLPKMVLPMDFGNELSAHAALLTIVQLA